MSGALIQLVAKGAQDVFYMSGEGMSLFTSKYTRHTNFAQAPKLIKEFSLAEDSCVIPTSGDLLTGLWFEGTNLIEGFQDSIIDLYIGGQKVDSQPFDFISDIYQNYLADTYTKSQEINNKCSVSNTNFIPLTFFFNSKSSYIPMVALQYHQVEIRVRFKKNSNTPFTAKLYGNYVYLDAPERKRFTSGKHDFIVTQTQTIKEKMVTGYNDYDLSTFNHPVKSLFFGVPTKSSNVIEDRFTFDTADILLNGTHLLEGMSPTYFHSVQNYYKSEYGVSGFNEVYNTPFYTRYYAYHFCTNASDYKSTGTCNFSRLDNANLQLRDIKLGTLRTGEDIRIYAVNFNVLRVQDGMAGILFGN
jgi:hypothetical protein|tara:strand:+ start:2078 stop:3151 length:1074 start_codon:yes stop_codon:yes gene_type:complete